MELPDLGAVLLAKSKKARRLSMTVKPLRGIRVAVPYRTSFKEGMAFLESNIYAGTQSSGIFRAQFPIRK